MRSTERCSQVVTVSCGVMSAIFTLNRLFWFAVFPTRLVAGLWLAITHRAGQQFRCLWNLCRHVGLWHIFYHPSLATVWQNGLTTNATTSEPFNLGLVILALVWSGHTVFEVNTICLMGLTSFPSWVLVSTRFFNGAFSMHGCESNQQTTGLLPDNSRWKNIRLALIWQELPRIVQLDQKFFFGKSHNWNSEGKYPHSSTIAPF